MGGEWWFNFILKEKDTFDLKAYQALLPQLKAEFKPMFDEAKPGYDFQVFWCPDEPLPPADNIYARFTYTCRRNHAPSWGEDHPVWHLFWDPTIVSRELCDSNIHCRCGPCCGVGSKLQEKLLKAFPEHFDYYNNYKWDLACEYESMREYDREEELLDYTACDKECGYCGKCPY